MNKNLNKEVEAAYEKRYEKKLASLLKAVVVEKDSTILPLLLNIIETEQENGFILNVVVKAYFRIKRNSNNDCDPLFELSSNDDYTVNESLLEVLGYDKVIPEYETQKKIIEMYRDLGLSRNRSYYSDPRNGLIAACAGWEGDIVKDFLEYCIETGDARSKYIAENSLKKKYVKIDLKM